MTATGASRWSVATDPGIVRSRLLPVVLTALLLPLPRPVAGGSLQAPAGSVQASDARAAVAEGDRLEAENTPESRRRAIELWREARRSWALAGRPDEEARTLNRIGLAHRRLGEIEVALAHYAEALTLWRRIEDQEGEATTLHYVGVARHRLGDLSGAAEAYSAALELRRSIGDRAGIATTQNSLGSLDLQLGRPDDARSRLQEALAIRRELGNRRGQAAPLLNLGAIYNDRGLVDRAEAYFRQGLEIARDLSDARLEAAALNNLAVASVRAGDLQTALDYYRQAQALHEASGDPEVVATGQDNLGRLFERLGNRDRALRYYNETLLLARQLGNRRLEAKAHTRHGRHRLDGDEAAAARRHFEIALHLSRQVKEQALEAVALDGLGESYTRLGRPERALPLHRQALGVWRQLGRPYEQAETLDHLGVAHLARGDLELAEVHFRQAVDLDRAIGNPNGEALRLRRIAGLLRDRGQLDEARIFMSQALAIVESVRSRLVSLDLRAGYASRHAEHYDFYVDLLMELAEQQPSAGYQAAAFAVSERSRARSLLEALSSVRPQFAGRVPAALLEREGELRRQINGLLWYRGRRPDPGPPNPEATSSWELELLFTRYEGLEAEIRQQSSAYAELVPTDSLSLSEIQSTVLDADTLLLHYHLGERRSFLWSITPESVQSYALPPRSALESEVLRAHELLTARNRKADGETIETRHRRLHRADTDYRTVAAGLSRSLLGPVASELDRRRLLIVPDGALHYLPFGALPRPSDALRQVATPASVLPGVAPTPLAASHQVIHLPSASVVERLRGRSRSAAQAKTLAVFADPVFEPEDPRVTGESRVAEAAPATLPEPISTVLRDVGLSRFTRLRHSRGEALGISELVPTYETLQALDFEASLNTLRSSQLSHYRYLHFATHAVLDTRQPQLSGIVLSLVDENGRAQDGFLRLDDIFELDLAAELVVLSACRTALGREVRGEGLIGVTRGFLHAGARRVLASLWQVDDRTTATLMQRFYDGLLGRNLSPSVALQEAQISMLREGKPPYDWAGFILQGDWR